MMTLALFLHLVCLTILATGGIGGVIVHQMIVSTHATAPAQLPGVVRLMPRFGITAQVGGLLMLASGVFLLYTRGWADWGQPWLYGKIVLWLILAINGGAVARPIGLKLAAAIAAGATGEDTAAAVAYHIRCLTLIHWVQVAGLVAIISLGVFGPR